MKIIEWIDEMEAYVKSFCQNVMYDFYNLECCRSYSSKTMRPSSQNYITDEDMFDRGLIDGSYKIFENPRRKSIPRLSTLFDFIRMEQFRFEDYFYDFGFHYPFPVDNSKHFYSVLDAIHRENAKNNPDRSPTGQATINFISTINYISDYYHRDRKKFANQIMSLAFMNRQTIANILRKNKSPDLGDVLRVSYILEIHPYEILGLHQIIYPWG